jgi:hypothetical protein
MLLIFREVRNGFKLIFPHKKFRWILVILSGVAAGISVSELLVMKLFSEIIIEGSDVKQSSFKFLLVFFVLFFFITRLGQYFQKNYRVRVFENSFKSLKIKRVNKHENAEWLMAFELTNILSYAVQLIAILAFFVLINPLLATINALIIICILSVIGKIFSQQITLQKNNQKNSKQKGAAYRHTNRVRAGEGGALASGVGMLILLVLLLFFSINEQISMTNALVFFLGARLQNGVLSNISRSLAKYVRSQIIVFGNSDVK